MEVSSEARAEGMTEKEEGKRKDELGLENRTTPHILHLTFCTGRRKCNYMCPRSLFIHVWLVEVRGCGSIFALWQPALPYSMLIDTCSAF